ncbi:MAG: TetR/AcrR family transcriptional regulator [Oxalobacteraceae bacterium]|nr:MAG: TetR/AcrR family transcriptional regulator [Oxalobacteraceae bacterium]
MVKSATEAEVTGGIKQQRAAVAPRKIIEAARRLFIAHGFHQTAMSDLAKEAGVSVGAIYHAYSGKSDVIKAIIEESSQEFLDYIAEVVARVEAGEIGVTNAIESIVEFCLPYEGEGLRHEVLAEAHRNPEIAVVFAKYGEQYRERFRILIGLANRAFAETEMEAGVELMLAFLFGVGHRDLTAPTLDRRATVQGATRLIVRALGV